MKQKDCVRPEHWAQANCQGNIQQTTPATHRFGRQETALRLAVDAVVASLEVSEPGTLEPAIKQNHSNGNTEEFP